MPPTYTPITLQQMGELLTPQGFRVMNLSIAEMVYGKRLAKNVCLQVYTSIDRTGYARDCGSDAIRVAVVRWYPGGRSKGIGKSKRVHRTQGWRENLQSRIDALEAEYGSAVCPTTTA